MSCFEPLRGIYKGKDENGKKILKIVPMKAWTSEAFSSDVKFFEIPCGHCIGCRADQAKEWANRLLLESQDSKFNYFVTLTYSDLYVPRNAFGLNLNTGEVVERLTLSKEHVQKFMKRLRRRLDCPVRYYCAGEYGDQTERPHYHLILFLFDRQLDLCQIGYGNPPRFSCELIQECWSDPVNGEPFGKVEVDPANYYTFKYVAQYVTKKIGIRPNEQYIAEGRLPPFSLMSRKPGIGSRYFDVHPECQTLDKLVIGTPDGAVEISPSKYFKKKVREIDPVYADEVADRNLKKAYALCTERLHLTNELYYDRIETDKLLFTKKQKQRIKI